MPSIFKAKTQEGHTIKSFGELLQHNIKTACFEINENGIYLRQMDTHRRILADACLLKENFITYKFKSDERLFIGLNLNHFHKMLKSIKKKDSLTLFINEDNPGKLGIIIHPKENQRISTSFIQIQSQQNIEICLPTGYSSPSIVPANEYQKMCKEMLTIGNLISVKSKNSCIKFICDGAGIYSREVMFGEVGLSNEDSSDDENENEEFKELFDTEQLYRIIKVAGISTQLQIYTKNSLPLLFKCNIGNLGTLQMYIKSKSQLEMEEIQDNTTALSLN